MLYSVVIPVYKNEESLAQLLAELGSLAADIARDYKQKLEVVFVVDASPDRSYALLQAALPSASFKSQLILHSRNFGSFAAIRTGLAAGRGEYFGIIAADRQEPTDLLARFLKSMLDEKSEIAIGVREERHDEPSDRFASNTFWSIYRRFVMPEIPKGGVDVFACTRQVRDHLLAFNEANTSLVAQIFWLGFKRSYVAYVRRRREHGSSAWTFRKKMKYLLDSIFAFTDLPIRLIALFGGLAVAAAVTMGLIVAIWRLSGYVDVPGYAAIMITILFFGGLNALGIGIVGAYTWRSYENTKGRPLAVVHKCQAFEGERKEGL